MHGVSAMSNYRRRYSRADVPGHAEPFVQRIAEGRRVGDHSPAMVFADHLQEGDGDPFRASIVRSDAAWMRRYRQSSGRDILDAHRFDPTADHHDSRIHIKLHTFDDGSVLSMHHRMDPRAYRPLPGRFALRLTVPVQGRYRGLSSGYNGYLSRFVPMAPEHGPLSVDPPAGLEFTGRFTAADWPEVFASLPAEAQEKYAWEAAHYGFGEGHPPPWEFPRPPEGHEAYDPRSRRS